MTNYCSECGFRLEKQPKFCPNCGTKISSGNKNLNPQSDEELQESVHIKVVVCQNCGEENSYENDVCLGCGVVLNGEEKIFVQQSDDSKKDISSKSKVIDHKSKAPQKENKFKTIQEKNISEEKELDSKKIILLGSLIGALVLVILFTSGVLDSKTNELNVKQNESSNVDLSNIQAMNDLEEKIKANPVDLESLLHLAHLQNDSKLFEKAIQNYRKYLDVKPEDADARVDMGICFYNLGDYPKAILEMEIAIKYQPTHQIAHLNLGIVNLTASNLDKSKEWFKKAIELNPDTEVARRAQELLNSH